MADDGGSTGQLRDELGVLPPGDVRQCLVALSEYDRVRELFNYRFEEGTFAGHAFGNLFLTALEKMTGNFAEAVEEASQVLNIVGSVEPINLDPVTLGYGDRVTARSLAGSLTSVTLTLKVACGQLLQSGSFANTQPEGRMRPYCAADLVVVAPGNIYGSLAPSLIVLGVSEVLNHNKS